MLFYKKATFWIILAAIIACVVLAVVFLTNPPEKDNTEDNSYVSDVGGVDMPDDTEVFVHPLLADELKKEYPEYFGLDTSKGLEVYIWQMNVNNYSCGLMSGTNRTKTEEEIMALKDASITEMRAILEEYDIPRDEVTVIPINHSLSGYYYEITEEYREKVTEKFWATISTSTFTIPGWTHTFELPYASCTLGAVTFASDELLLTLKWELKDGFTESTKTEYPKYHVKFTVGDSERFTFVPLPNEWTGDGATFTDTYRLNMPIDTDDATFFELDLYLNDDKTFVRNLTSVYLARVVSSYRGVLLDTKDFDIDGDGSIESCSLYSDSSFTIDSFTIKAFSGGKLKYYNTFTQGDYSAARFYKNEDGRYVLKCVDYSNNNDARYYDIKVVNGDIVLSHEGKVFIPSIVEEPDWSPVIDTMEFDIDGDGRVESCTISVGPTSGIYSFNFTAQENGKVKYHNTFACYGFSYYADSFYEDENGKVSLKCTSGDSVRYYDISVKLGVIYLTHEDEAYGYWGVQGVKE